MANNNYIPFVLLYFWFISFFSSSYPITSEIEKYILEKNYSHGYSMDSFFILLLLSTNTVLRWEFITVSKRKHWERWIFLLNQKKRTRENKLNDGRVRCFLQFVIYNTKIILQNAVKEEAIIFTFSPEASSYPIWNVVTNPLLLLWHWKERKRMKKTLEFNYTRLVLLLPWHLLSYLLLIFNLRVKKSTS